MIKIAISPKNGINDKNIKNGEKFTSLKHLHLADNCTIKNINPTIMLNTFVS